MTLKALLIIDMQVGSFTPMTLRYNTAGIIETINRLSELFRSNNLPVIFIRHDGTKEGYFLPGTDEWQVLPQLIRKHGDFYIEKTINDSFYKSDLKATLEKLSVNELYFVGCATDFCLDATIKSALGKDYKITVVKDGHTTADRPFVNAKTLIDHHNWLWSELAPAAFPLKVVPCSEIMDSLMISDTRI